MNLELLNFDTLVQRMVTAAQGKSDVPLQLATGSPLRADFEAKASVDLWLQWLILQTLWFARASTSTGDDLDSWMAQYDLTRLSAAAATGVVRFTRFTALGTSVIVVPGKQVRTLDGLQTFTVTTDTSYASWDGTGYVMGPGVSYVDAPVIAATAGAAGNVQADTITVLLSAIEGVDICTNPAPTSGGYDQESDEDFLSRFWAYIASLSKATKAAIEYAIESVQQGVGQSLQENVDETGDYKPGNFIATIDDGGATPDSLIDAVGTAIEATRALTVTYAVHRATGVTVNVSGTLTISSGASQSAAIAAAETAVEDYITSLGLGATLPFTRLYQVVYDALATITDVTGLTLNSGTADLTCTPSQRFRAGSVVFS